MIDFRRSRVGGTGATLACVRNDSISLVGVSDNSAFIIRSASLSED